MQIETHSHFTPVSITLETQKEIDRLFLFLDREARSEHCVGDTYLLIVAITNGLRSYASATEAV